MEMKKQLLLLGITIIILGVGLSGCNSIAQDSIPQILASQEGLISDMIHQMDEKEIYSTVYDLQNFTTRCYGYSGNIEASTYLYNKLSNISGLDVEYQGGELRNVIATLPGKDNSSSDIYMVGAHYDSISDEDRSVAPGATDDGGGVAIVLELARVMSQYSFNHTVKFAFWNTEESSSNTSGSVLYAKYAGANHLKIPLYMNFDSSCYDPDDRFVLDIMFNNQSQWVSEMMTEHNDLYDIGFNLTYNVHKCGSDHLSFRGRGYTAVMTHSETHGPDHSANDTIDKVSSLYAKKNGQLGMSVIARLAEVNQNSQNAEAAN